MESKCKVLFAYPVAYKENITKEDMCIPSPYLTGIEPNSAQTVVVTIGFSIDYRHRAYLLVDVAKVGEQRNYDNIAESGRVETLKAAFFGNDLGIFLSSFFIQDLKIEHSGYYEIEVKLFEADNHGDKTDVVLDSYTSEFFVEVKESDNA